ncbi:MAG: mannosyltransferase B-like protein [Candidatus Woesebacteria bacterium GW2011_GWD1_41_12]|uniref:Mannosyltransferase B-like protein n=1 Tax=Candidatus Woesebacteria bacterium GW2011_GWD1_41_12 TaxID=1618593 RepID=A0A0G0UPM5_9BACT|nr:MAG: mannosyltransferase B-like protein [Candidatus Woesebacteria bacterium GW2011_GWD1_41_12]
MKVAVDIGPLKSGDNVRGIGVYTRELVNTLESIQKTGSNKFELYPVDYFDHQPSSVNHYDVAHLTRFNPFSISVPLKKPKNIKFVLTIYDLIPLIYPDNYPPGFRGWINWQINKFLIKRNIDAIITISETSKKDICRFIGINPDKVYVTYLAARPIFKKLEIGNWELEIKKHYGLPDRFALYVGDINYNKNLPVLIESCKIAKIPLVMVGKQILEIEKMDLNHSELGHLKNIDLSGLIRTGFVSDEDLVKIYNLATVYIQPSLYEGFGLPLMEAFATGVPSIASKTQALVEIAGDAALFADTKDTKNFAEKIKLLVSDSKLKEELIRKGLENAKKYSWQKAAEETFRVYRKISNF